MRGNVQGRRTDERKMTLTRPAHGVEPILGLQVLLNWSVPKVIGVESGNSEMTAQVHQVDRTQISGHGHKRQASGSFCEDHRSAHIGAIENNPHVRGSVVNRTSVVRRCHHVLPATQMI